MYPPTRLQAVVGPLESPLQKISERMQALQTPGQDRQPQPLGGANSSVTPGGKLMVVVAEGWPDACKPETCPLVRCRPRKEALALWHRIWLLTCLARAIAIGNCQWCWRVRTFPQSSGAPASSLSPSSLGEHQGWLAGYPAGRNQRRMSK